MAEKGCIKCGGKETETKEIATTGSGLSRIFDIQHNKFLVVYCKNCGYSELYHRNSSKTANVIDLFLSG